MPEVSASKCQRKDASTPARTLQNPASKHFPWPLKLLPGCTCYFCRGAPVVHCKGVQALAFAYCKLQVVIGPHPARSSGPKLQEFVRFRCALDPTAFLVGKPLEIAPRGGLVTAHDACESKQA